MTLTVFSSVQLLRVASFVTLLTVAQSGVARTLERVELVIDGETVVLQDVEISEGPGTMRLTSGPAVIRSGHCEIEMAGMSRLSVKSIEARSVSIVLDGHARLDVGALVTDDLDLTSTGATSFRSGEAVRQRHIRSQAGGQDRCM